MTISSIDEVVEEVGMFDLSTIKKFERGFWFMCIDNLFTFSIGFSSVVLGSGEYYEKF